MGYFGSSAGGAPKARHEFCRWSSGRFVALFTVGGGLGSAVVAYVATLMSWGNCASEPEPGGNFTINVLGFFGLFVMPAVAATSAGMAVGAHNLLRGSVRWRHLSDVAPKVIVAAGVIALVGLIALWVMLGNPPEGYCREVLG